jgi:hypothetical protein
MEGIVPNAVVQRKDKIGYAVPPTFTAPLTPALRDSLEGGLTRFGRLAPHTAWRILLTTDGRSVRLAGTAWRLFNFLRWLELADVTVND